MNPVPPEAIAAAQAAAIAAADRADQAAACHASWRRHLAALLAASLLPGAASLVFEEDEDTVTDDTEIRLICMRGPADELLWYNPCTEFADQPDAVELGEPPSLDDGTLSAIEFQLREAYDAVCGGFGTAADVMTGANLLVLTIPSAAPSLPRRVASGTAMGDEMTAADVRAAMREASAAFLDSDSLEDASLSGCAHTLATGFRDLDTGTVTTVDGWPAFTDDAPVQLAALDRFQADEPDDETRQDPELFCMTCAAALLAIQHGSTLGLLVQKAIEHECSSPAAGRT